MAVPREPRSAIKAITPHQRRLLAEAVEALADALAEVREMDPMARSWGTGTVVTRLESLAELLAEPAPYWDTATCLKRERNRARDIPREARAQARAHAAASGLGGER